MASEFSLIADPEVTEYRVVRIASQAYAIGDAVALDHTSDAVDVVPATSSTTTNDIFGVAMQTAASTDTALLVCLIRAGQRWAATVANNSNTNHNYQRMALSDATKVNNTGTDVTTDVGVFLQTGTIGAASDKRIVGEFLRTPGVSV